MDLLQDILDIIAYVCYLGGGGVALWGAFGIGIGLNSNQGADLQNNFMKIGGGVVIFLTGAGFSTLGNIAPIPTAMVFASIIH